MPKSEQDFYALVVYASSPNRTRQCQARRNDYSGRLERGCASSVQLTDKSLRSDWRFRRASIRAFSGGWSGAKPASPYPPLLPSAKLLTSPCGSSSSRSTARLESRDRGGDAVGLKAESCRQADTRKQRVQCARCRGDHPNISPWTRAASSRIALKTSEGRDPGRNSEGGLRPRLATKPDCGTLLAL